MEKLVNLFGKQARYIINGIIHTQMETTLKGLADINTERGSIIDHRDLISQKVESILSPHDVTEPEELLLEISKVMPVDAADEVFRCLTDDEKTIGNVSKVRLLSLIAITSLSNLLDDLMESRTVEGIGATNTDILNLTITTTRGPLNISEIMSKIGDYLEGNDVIQKDYLLEIVRKIIATQEQFHTPDVIKSVSLKDSMVYRSGTLGNYYVLLEDISGKKGVANLLSQIQMEDDLEDIEEDEGNQINPFAAFCRRYGIKNKSTILQVLNKYLNLDDLKILVEHYKNHGVFEPNLFARIKAWFLNKDFIALEEDNIMGTLNELFTDYIILEEFYTLRAMRYPVNADERT